VTTFALIGSGFRARMFLKVARELGTIRCGGVVVRTPRPLDVPAFTPLDECLRELSIDFVLTATPSSVTPHVIAAAVDRGLPVLAETPPAADLDGLRALWSAVGDSGLVQVAEQYPMMPSHAARAALVATGAIGTPTQVQVSSTQHYHAIALIRSLLRGGRGPVSVRNARASTTSPNSRRVTSCGSGGSQCGDRQASCTTTRWYGWQGPAHSFGPPLVRRQTGYDLDLAGYDTEHISFGSELLYRNPYPGRRWMDDEIAMATLLERTASWVRGDGPEPYPLAEGAHDQQLALAIEQSADSDSTVTTPREAWT
jgi:predicted dehydrogenase